MDSIVVRAGRPDDIGAVVDCWHAMRLDAGHEDDRLVSDWHAALTAFLVGQLAAGAGAIWLAETGSTIVGTTLVLLKEDFPFFLFRPGFYAFIGGVYTAPAWRGHGIATGLVRRAVQWARDRGASEVRLLPTAASRSIYERVGFERVDDMALPLA